MADERTFREQFAIDVRTRCEAIAINPAQKTVDLRNTLTGEVTTEAYDKLVLSPGATPITPPLPGINLPGVFRVRTVPDAKAIREWIEGHTMLPSGMDAYTGYQTLLPAQRAVVVGGGFIGLEMAENLTHLGLQVTVLQRDNQVMSPMDPEMARYVENHLIKHGVRVVLSANVSGFRQAAYGSLEVRTEADEIYPAEPAVEQAPGVVNIPLHELRARLNELPRDREIHVICRSGQRAYYATRILLQNGFQVRNLSGGMLSHINLA